MQLLGGFAWFASRFCPGMGSMQTGVLLAGVLTRVLTGYAVILSTGNGRRKD
jgi:hypothetical protein